MLEIGQLTSNLSTIRDHGHTAIPQAVPSQDSKYQLLVISSILIICLYMSTGVSVVQLNLKPSNVGVQGQLLQMCVELAGNVNITLRCQYDGVENMLVVQLYFASLTIDFQLIHLPDHGHTAIPQTVTSQASKCQLLVISLILI